MPLLRFFWQPVIDLLGSVASTCFLHDAQNTKFDIAGHETSVIAMDDLAVCSNPFLAVVLEIVLALQRLVDSEMVYADKFGNLSASEWESFIKAIDIGISPWLVSRGNGSPSLAQEIRIEAMAIFSQLTSFLGKCADFECGFHPIDDDDARKYLHLFLLRKVSPLIQMMDSFPRPLSHPALVGDDATTLALVVIKSWSVVTHLPFKGGPARSAELLAEAFAIPKSQPIEACRYFVGGYLHHPAVRLEALKSLVDDDSTDIDYSSVRDSDSVSTSGISNSKYTV